jgi:hypothetical protein
MSIADDIDRDSAGRRRDKRGQKGCDAGLWHASEEDAGGRRLGRASKGRQLLEPPVFESSPSGEPLWKSRIELVVTAGLSGEAARHAHAQAERDRSEQTFFAFRDQCNAELRPVLEASASMLEQWGLRAHVSESLRDRPTRLPRSFDLSLGIDRFEKCGPGRLTITGTEACDFVRVKLKIGPTHTGDVDEHVGTTVVRDLSDALVGGLVATLVERFFGP